jgi:hypothetical protein
MLRLSELRFGDTSVPSANSASLQVCGDGVLVHTKLCRELVKLGAVLVCGRDPIDFGFGQEALVLSTNT